MDRGTLLEQMQDMVSKYEAERAYLKREGAGIDHKQTVESILLDLNRLMVAARKPVHEMEPL